MDSELIDEFVSESKSGLQQIESDLLQAERDGSTELLGSVFRTVHSLKGTGSFLGFSTLVALAHEAEAIMEQVRDGVLPLSPPVMDGILKATDRLLELFDTENFGESENVDEEVTLLRSLAVPDSEPFADEESSVYGKERVLTIRASAKKLREAPDCKKGIAKGLEKIGTLEEIPEGLESHDGEVQLQLKSPLSAEIVAELFHLDGKAVQYQSDDKETSLYSADSSAPKPAGEGALMDKQATPTAVAKNEPQRKPSKKTTAVGQSKASQVDSTMRVNTKFLDDLLEFTGNMVMARNQLLSRYQFQDDMSFATMSRCITDVHKSVVQQRMQTIGNLFDRFHRLVRDLSFKLQKEVELFVEGGDIELDRTILEAFSDPLTHMVRNAIDHALETPEERMAAGKNRVGRIVLRAYHQSGEVIVEVEDDGRGIDLARVSEKALEKGIVSQAQLDAMQPREVVNLIFAPGFSTKNAATDISGRGVGMDVVRTNIENIGGSIEVHTNPGSGSLLAFSLPLTQAVVSSSLMSALVVEAAGQRFAIPETGVNEIIRIDPQEADDSIRIVEGSEVFRLRDRVLSIIHLEDALGLKRTWTDDKGVVHEDRRNRIADRRASESPEQAAKMANRRSVRDRRVSKQTLIVIEFRRSFFGIMVDRVLGIEEVVVRSSPKLVDAVSVFAGHTVLGDGSVIMMADIHGIVDEMDLQFADEDAQPLAVRGALKTAQQMIVFNNAKDYFFCGAVDDDHLD